MEKIKKCLFFLIVPFALLLSVILMILAIKRLPTKIETIKGTVATITNPFSYRGLKVIEITWNEPTDGTRWLVFPIDMIAPENVKIELRYRELAKDANIHFIQVLSVKEV